MIKKTKHKLSSLILAITFALVGIAFPTGKLFSSIANAQTQETVSLSNSHFNNNKDASYLDTNPTGWTKLTSAQGTYGIINTAEGKFNKSTYKLTENPQTLTTDSTDTKVLMLNARRSEESELINDKNVASQGYESNAISIPANSYYQVSILAKSEIGAFGSIYLKGVTAEAQNQADDLAKLTKFEKIQTSGNWAEYIFFIETGQDSQDVKLQLWLGESNQGNSTSPYAVFYDNIRVTKFAQTAFQNQLANYNSKPNVNVVSLKQYLLPSVENANFEINDITAKNVDGNRYWTPVSNFPINSAQKIVDATKPLTARNSDGTIKTYNFLNSNNKIGDNALWLAANEVNGFEFGYKSTNLQIAKFEYYKISISVKVDANTTAKVVLQENDDIKKTLLEAGLKEDEISYTEKSETFTITSNPTDNSLANNYGTYTFYVKASSLYSTSLHLQLLLAPTTESQNFSGSALFDDITVEAISSAQYTSTSNSTYVKKLDMEVTSSSSLSVANGTFNLVNVERDEKSYPLAPQNWTISQDDSLKSKAGIINLQTKHFNDNKANYGINVNPGNPSGISTDEQTNNVLMLWNNSQTYQSATSDNISVNSNTIYTLSFAFKTTQPGSNFNISVLNQDNVRIYKTSKVTSIASDDYSSSNMWIRDFKINVRTGSSTTGLKIVFGLGDENLSSTGHLFIDNVTIKTSTMNETTLLEKLASPSLFEKTIDMSNLLLNAPYRDENGNLIITAFSEATLQNYPVNGANAGVVNGTANNKDIANAKENDTNNQFIYYIETLGKANYGLTSKEQLTLTSNTIYKFSVWINTRIKQQEQTDKEEDKYGASFALSEIADASVNNINTNGEWKEYVIIVNTTADAKANLKLSLLSLNSETDGIAFFENFKMTTLNQNEYQEYVTEFKKDEKNPNLLIIGSTDPVKDEDPETPSEPEDFNYLVLPSMFTALALVIAIIAVVLRRVNFKKFVKKQKTEYDRKKTLYKDVIRKEAQTLRDKNIEEVNKEINKLDEQILNLEEANKERLEKSRKEKGRQIDSASEKQFKLYAKQRTKLERQKIALVEKVAKYNTAEYLLSLQEEVTKKQLEKLK